MLGKKKKTNLFVEIAKDDFTRQAGLMHRKHLGENQGMIFCFASDSRYSFWMKNTYLPLDLAFINASGKILEIKPLIPLSTRSIRSSYPCRYAIETNRGWFERYGIKVGDTVFSSKTKNAQSAEAPSVRLDSDFKSAVDLADERKWNIVITYRYPEPRKETKEKRLLREQTPSVGPFGDTYSVEAPTQKIVARELLISGVDDLPGETKPYVFQSGKADKGDRITARVKNGEIRSFTLSGIEDWAFQTSDGLVMPNEINVEDLAPIEPEDLIYEPDGQPQNDSDSKEREIPDFEEIPINERDIPFWDGQLPYKKPDKKPKKDRSWKNMWGLLGESERRYKEAQTGGADGGNMMVEYWEALRKKRGKGLSEGEAVLEFLKENEEAQKRQNGSAEKTKV